MRHLYTAVLLFILSIQTSYSQGEYIDWADITNRISEDISDGMKARTEKIRAAGFSSYEQYRAYVKAEKAKIKKLKLLKKQQKKVLKFRERLSRKRSKQRAKEMKSRKGKSRNRKLSYLDMKS